MCLRIYSVVSWLLGQVSIDQCDEKDIKISYQYSFKRFRASILLFHGISAYLLTWLLSKAFQGTKWNFFFTVWWLNYTSPRRSAILQYLCRTQKRKQSESYEEYAHCIPKFFIFILNWFLAFCRCLLSCSLSFFHVLSHSPEFTYLFVFCHEINSVILLKCTTACLNMVTNFLGYISCMEIEFLF